MTEFKGTYNSFHELVSGYARNKTLSLTRKHKSGVCACCGTNDKEIHAAHKRGCERKDLVRKFFFKSVTNQSGDIYTVDLDNFTKLFIDFTSDISNFHFLCESCHKRYDDGIIDTKDFKYKKESIK